ncbi:hypothetical protein [Erwinia sp. OPT-41]|uniref:Uncharacterized protein n=1 Tax=Erwinia plantamica TaxID=3237104 RepID=A0ABW7CRJ3_9GAMM
MDGLIDGTGSTFANALMRDDYEGFFLRFSTNVWRFHLIRPETGTGEGMVPLLIIRENKDTNALELAYFGGHFFLNDGMGGGGHFKLKTFLQFLKRHSKRLDLRAYMFDVVYRDAGAHNPCFYLNKS